VSAVVDLPHGLLDSLVFVALVVAVLIVFWGTQHDLACAVAAWKRQRLQDHVEPIARLVRERRADREPKNRGERLSTRVVLRVIRKTSRRTLFQIASWPERIGGSS
jgi:hypothetical protein